MSTLAVADGSLAVACRRGGGGGSSAALCSGSGPGADGEPSASVSSSGAMRRGAGRTMGAAAGGAFPWRTAQETTAATSVNHHAVPIVSLIIDLPARRLRLALALLGTHSLFRAVMAPAGSTRRRP